MSISRRELFDVWRAEESLALKNSAVISYVSTKYGLGKESDDQDSSTKLKINNFNSKLSQKWTECNRMLSTFLKRESKWLDKNVTFSIHHKTTNPPQEPSGSQQGRGRPTKDFQEASSSTKKRKISPLVENYSTEELMFAAERSLRLSGQRDTAKIVQEVSETSSKTAAKIKKVWKSPAMQPIKYTPEEALALFIDGHFTKHTYILMQSGAKARHANIYPPYHTILQAKKDCYPEAEAIRITEISAEVTVQALVNHTITRLAMVQEDVFSQNIDDLSHGLKIIFKWGCDGSSGHSNYKQKFTEGNAEDKTDSSLFAVCIVPLQIQATKTNVIMWHNSKPSSTRFCRPIKLLFEKETAVLSKKEIENVEKQIEAILPTQVFIAGKEIKITPCFKLTMIDGKMFGVITDTSNQACAICGVTPKTMNNLQMIHQLSSDASKYEYGLSTLHAWIRCFECLLHIAYRLPVKKWQMRSEEDKQIFSQTKKHIQNELRLQMGLLVDIPKPGYGTTNDGNSASRFFDQHTLAASITGLDEDLINRFNVILQTISCGYAVDPDAFRNYAKVTAEKYVQLYPWYNMPSSVHKLLLHGADIIEAALLPIGMFSEEALEARNKDFRRYREFHTRKFSRVQTMTDLFNTLLFSSDPLISSISHKSHLVRSYNTKALDDNVKSLLKQPHLTEDETDTNKSEDEGNHEGESE